MADLEVSRGQQLYRQMVFRVSEQIDRKYGLMNGPGGEWLQALADALFEKQALAQTQSPTQVIVQAQVQALGQFIRERPKHTEQIGETDDTSN